MDVVSCAKQFGLDIFPSVIFLDDTTSITDVTIDMVGIMIDSSDVKTRLLTNMRAQVFP